MEANNNNINLNLVHSFFSSSSMDMADPMLSGISLQTLLNISPSLSFLTDHPPPPPPPPPPLKPLLIPKIEQHPHQYPPQQYLITPQPHLEQPFNFFPKRPRLDYSTAWYPTAAAAYSSPDTSSSNSSSPSLRAKQPRSFSYSSSPSVIPQSNLARQRRQKLSEKTRCLQKLMPWDKKMDQATLLEEAYKYVKFLQAQVTVLQSMPAFTVANMPPQQQKQQSSGGGGGVVFGELERLSRNQVLQVLVNSPVAQTVMSSQGLCVFSVEQLGLLRKLSERRLILQHMNMNMNIVSSDSNPNFFN